MKRLAYAAAAVILTSSCGGDDPAAFSQPIGINLKVESGDVKTGNAISNEKGITTESGNPWAKFVTDARAALGKDPSDVDLSGLSMLLAATSTGVTGFEEIFTGEVVVQFVMETSNNVVPVARIASPTGRGPLEMSVQFDYSTIAAQDRDKFYNGSYKVVLAGA